MILLLGFAFIAGIVTILSPCILPILPIVLTSTIGGQEIGKSRPIGVVIGFVVSFTFFTLFLSTIVRISGISADVLRLLSVVVIAGFGASLLIPQFQILLERLFSKLAGLMPSSQNKTGFGGGILIGLSLGLLWTPCVGPILASVISLAITGTVSFDAFLITLVYSLGTAIPMFLIMLGGQNALKRVPWLLANTSKIQKMFGVLMIVTAIGIFFNIDRRFQTFILNTFPQYGVGLTKFEDNEVIKKQLNKTNNVEIKKEDMGKPTFDLFNTKGPIAPELILGGQWFNSIPLNLQELRGKVVLIDFWTYTCINCIRTLPYLKNWHQKYKDEGLIIIGVHTPEFEFEKNPDNVTKAIKDFGLEYPIMQDNDFATWKAYNNRYWPAEYFIDKNGRIRRTHFGEGEYDESEEFIQKLLKETGAQVDQPVSNATYQIQTRTPELYLGYRRIEYFSSPEQIQPDKPTIYSIPSSIPKNTFAYGGVWTIGGERAMPQSNTTLILNFESANVYLVMRPASPAPAGAGKSKTSQVKVFLDDQPAGKETAGEDVVGGIVQVDTDRLYKLIKLTQPSRHLLKLEFLDDNVEVFAFTFG